MFMQIWSIRQILGQHTSSADLGELCKVITALIVYYDVVTGQHLDTFHIFSICGC